jgi:hypothetical protein|tara:strand:- start:17474 stop:17671 length:198 start_codon:yes stop_codon:yes gene_type:complete
MLHMRNGFFTGATALVFLAVGIGHGVRVLYGWEVTVDTWAVPIWVSLLASLLGFILAWHAIRSLR